MKNPQKVCRLCLSENRLLLDLFGPDKIYAKEIKTCLSLEVKEGDGLPQNICIKCVGQLEECSPYYSQVTNLHQEGRNYSGHICYFCRSDENHLFSIPESTLKQTETCFDFEVPRRSKVCHRCQFYLDTLFELKQKARSAVSQFDTNGIPSEKEQVEDSVEDIVHKLTHKFGRPKMSPKGKKKGRESEARVQVLDIFAYMGSSFFSSGSVSVKKFLNEMPSSPFRKRVRFQDYSDTPQSSPTKNKGILKNEHTETNKKACPRELSPDKVSPKRFKGPKSAKEIKVSLKLTQNIHSTLHKKRSSAFVNDDNDEIDHHSDSPHSSEPSVSHSRSRRRMSLDSDSEKGQQKTDMFQPVSKQSISNGKHSETVRDKSSRGKKMKKSSFYKRSTKSHAASGVQLSSDSDIDGVDSERKKNMVDDHPSDQLRKRKRKNYCESDVDVDAHPSDQPRKRKRKNYCESDVDVDDNFPRRALESESDAELNENMTSRQKKGQNHSHHSRNVSKKCEAPAYQKAVDKLLVNTPKSKFRPYICPICHEGYVSTVKGMLHKLMVHDSRSSFEIKVTRAEFSDSWKLLRKYEEIQDASSGNDATNHSDVAEEAKDIVGSDRVTEKLDLMSDKADLPVGEENQEFSGITSSQVNTNASADSNASLDNKTEDAAENSKTQETEDGSHNSEQHDSHLLSQESRERDNDDRLEKRIDETIDEDVKGSLDTGMADSDGEVEESEVERLSKVEDKLDEDAKVDEDTRREPEREDISKEYEVEDSEAVKEIVQKQAKEESLDEMASRNLPENAVHTENEGNVSENDEVNMEGESNVLENEVHTESESNVPEKDVHRESEGKVSENDEVHMESESNVLENEVHTESESNVPENEVHMESENSVPENKVPTESESRSEDEENINEALDADSKENDHMKTSPCVEEENVSPTTLTDEIPGAGCKVNSDSDTQAQILKERETDLKENHTPSDSNIDTEDRYVEEGSNDPLENDPAKSIQYSAECKADTVNSTSTNISDDIIQESDQLSNGN